jgi:hypothetical protein
MEELDRRQNSRARGNEAKRRPLARQQRNQARTQARTRNAKNSTSESDYGPGDPQSTKEIALRGDIRYGQGESGDHEAGRGMNETVDHPPCSGRGQNRKRDPGCRPIFEIVSIFLD